MQYNTKRDKLVMPEYGRAIQDMVKLAVSLPSKDKRQACAKAIVSVMARVYPQTSSPEDQEHKLWNHIAHISQYKLDVDYPVQIVPEEEASAHPAPLHYPMKKIKRRHYGYLVEESLRYAQTLPECEERDELVAMTANQMKQDLFVWNKDSMDEELVAEDIERYTDGQLGIDLESFKFASVSTLPGQSNSSQSKRKKKH